MAIAGEFCLGAMSSAFKKAIQRELEKARLKKEEELKKNTTETDIQPEAAVQEQKIPDQPKRKTEVPVSLPDSSSETTEPKKETPPEAKNKPFSRSPFASTAVLPARPPPKKIKSDSPPPLPLPPIPKTKTDKEPPKKVPESDSEDEDDYDDDDDDEDDGKILVKSLQKKKDPMNIVKPAPAPAPASAQPSLPPKTAEPDYTEVEFPVFMYFIPLEARSLADCQKFQLDIPSFTVHPEKNSLDVQFQLRKSTLKTDWVKKTLREASKQNYKFYDEDSESNIKLGVQSIGGMSPIITFVNEGQQKEWYDFFYEVNADGAASKLPSTSWVHIQNMSSFDNRSLTEVPKFRVAIFINSTDGPFKN